MIVCPRVLVIVAALFTGAYSAFAQAPRLQVGAWGDYVVEYVENERLAARVLEYARAQPPLPGLPDSAPTFGQTLRIQLAANDAHFNILSGGSIPEWGAGVAIPSQGLIILPGYSGGRGTGELRTVLRHELAHIALHRYLEPARIPRWFDEGYARWAAGELDLEGAWLLRLAFVTQRAPALDSLELAWPAADTDARIAYLLAASVVDYLVSESGTRGLTFFLQQWRQTQDFERALGAVYGLSLDQLESDWRKSVRQRYGWLAVLTHSGAFVFFAALVLIVLFAIRRRRDRAKLAALKEAEPPDDPAYWLEAEAEREPEEEGT